jgi:hypothetical protein
MLSKPKFRTYRTLSIRLIKNFRPVDRIFKMQMVKINNNWPNYKVSCKIATIKDHSLNSKYKQPNRLLNNVSNKLINWTLTLPIWPTKLSKAANSRLNSNLVKASLTTTNSNYKHFRITWCKLRLSFRRLDNVRDNWVLWLNKINNWVLRSNSWITNCRLPSRLLANCNLVSLTTKTYNNKWANFRDKFRIWLSRTTNCKDKSHNYKTEPLSLTNATSREPSYRTK